MDFLRIQVCLMLHPWVSGTDMHGLFIGRYLYLRTDPAASGTPWQQFLRYGDRTFSLNGSFSLLPGIAVTPIIVINFIF